MRLETEVGFGVTLWLGYVAEVNGRIDMSALILGRRKRVRERDTLVR